MLRQLHEAVASCCTTHARRYAAAMVKETDGLTIDGKEIVNVLARELKKKEKQKKRAS